MSAPWRSLDRVWQIFTSVGTFRFYIRFSYFEKDPPTFTHFFGHKYSEQAHDWPFFTQSAIPSHPNTPKSAKHPKQLNIPSQLNIPNQPPDHPFQPYILLSKHDVKKQLGIIALTR